MKIGEFIQQPQGFKTFVPDKFPHKDLSSVILNPQTSQLHARAAFLLGKLDGITQLLPDLDFFIFMYVRKEAAFSSEIEGTRATMIDAIRAEVELTRDLPNDVENILKYIDAMNYGLKRLENFPLSLRLIREVHKTLLEQTQGGIGKTPGEFRTSQNWIGGASPATARFVPPPVAAMHDALGDLEKFLHNSADIPPLIKTALAHSQFETIHPFLDGNGRTGRLLVTFYLCQQEVLERPVLYLSAYFKKHRDTYFDLLNGYHNKGEIVPWLNFFLEGVAEVAEAAIKVSQAINILREEDQMKIQAFGRSAGVAMKVLRALYKLPIVDVRKIQELTGYSRTAANNFVKKLVDLEILVQRNKKATYGRQFEYARYLKLFAKE
ncbi:MAG TPA: Fic family protein [Candidatus Paceibacterota bacterium]|nr:Fic family protein [Candidatus Paceibacterota bacterium]